ncbi:MAG: WD40 repeat domain-containing protein, partial [Crocosphaera sp.]|nr:WD40 repeat domain-containing protein [Crocosphaera sp.]
MSEESSQYNPKFEKQAQGFAIGDNNIIYNYYGYTEEVKVTPVDATDDNLTCPYRGLYHFTPNDSEFFFGRDVFVEKLFQATQTRNFIPVLGASGSGKSSVVLAGLIPKLEEEGHWKFTHFRPGVVRKQNKSSKVDPFYSLAKALVPLYTPSLNKSQQLVEASELAEFLHSGKVLLSDVITDIQTNYSNHRVLLIADQFEEIYTICQDEKLRRHFLDILIDNIYSPAGQSSSPFVFVLTMRADFLGNALSYRPFADILQGADIKLGAMSGEELSQVIEKPAEKLGVTFEEGLVERILNDVEKEPGNLPLLEFALTELWKKRTGKQLTHDAYKSSGQVKGALTKYADKKYSQLTPDEQEQARQIFIQLVRPGEGTEDTRRRANRVELGEENWHLITRKDGLADSRLVVTSRNDSEQETVEVVHESLIQNWDKLREWMETDRKFRVWQEQLRVAMRQWETTNKDKGSLLRGAALVNAEEYLRERPKDLIYEKEFIQQSIKERDHLKRLQLITFGIITAILAGFSFFAGYQWRKSEISQILALRQASEAKLLLNQDLDSLIDILRAAKTLKKSLLLQLFKPETQLQNQVELTLHKAIYQVKEKNIIKIPNEVNEVIFSPNDQLLAILQFDGTVSLLERTGKLSSRFKPFNVGGEVQSITFSADSQKLITVSTDEVVKYWDLNGQQIGKDLKQPGIINEVMLGSNGKVMIFSNNKLRDLESGTLLAEFPQEIGYGTLSPDGKLIAPGWAGDTITIWNV